MSFATPTKSNPTIPKKSPSRPSNATANIITRSPKTVSSPAPAVPSPLRNTPGVKSTTTTTHQRTAVSATTTPPPGSVPMRQPKVTTAASHGTAKVLSTTTTGGGGGSVAPFSRSMTNNTTSIPGSNSNGEAPRGRPIAIRKETKVISTTNTNSNTKVGLSKPLGSSPGAALRRQNSSGLAPTSSNGLRTHSAGSVLDRTRTPKARTSVIGSSAIAGSSSHAMYRRTPSAGAKPIRTPKPSVVVKPLSVSDARDALRDLMDRYPNQHDPKHAHNTDDQFVLFNCGDTILEGRYTILTKLGYGEFSTVWLAFDRHAAMTASFSDAFVAIKATRATVGAEYEASLLEVVLQTNHNIRTSGVVELRHRFIHQRADGQQHVCLVLPVLGPNLLCVIDPFRSHRGLRTSREIHLIRHLTRCIVHGLSELDSVNVVHTDLKPENILCTLPNEVTMSEISQFIDRASPPLELKINKPAYLSRDSRNPTLVKLTDFGLSYMLVENAPIQTHPSVAVQVIAPGVAFCDNLVLQTREYRAPEIILNMSFGCKTDIWSLGCIAYELVTGDFLMDPKRHGSTEIEIDLQHLALMVNLIGDFPRHFMTPRHREPHVYLQNNQYYKDIRDRLTRLPPRNLVAELSVFLPQTLALVCADFVLSCLKFDPATRPKARELLRHTWVTV
eukprot:PhF_6_TR13399/c0_g1_i1/m.21296/K08832/SRPK3, STK23; serine/threonine-protein kinase SRPK3